MKLKKRWVILILLMLIFIIVMASCFGKKGLAPGKYEVTQAVHEVKDNDYELQVKNYGEYDVDRLTIIKDPKLNNMVLEIKRDKTHTLYVQSDEDIIIDNEIGKVKKKTKKR